MFSFFKKKNNNTPSQPPADWSFLKADIHAHFLPGIDDGAVTINDTLQLVRQMQQMGYRKLVTTPHISLDYFPNKEHEILTKLAMVQQVLAQEGISVALEAAAEYMLDEDFLKRLEEQATLLTIGGQYVLFEMGFMQENPYLQQAIFRMQANGYKPVLAHPERYNYYHKAPLVFFEELKSRGCLLQLNVIALAGYYGKPVQLMAQRLLDADLYDFIGSDAHHLRHTSALRSLLAQPVIRQLQAGSFLNQTLVTG